MTPLPCPDPPLAIFAVEIQQSVDNKQIIKITLNNFAVLMALHHMRSCPSISCSTGENTTSKKNKSVSGSKRTGHHTHSSIVCCKCCISRPFPVNYAVKTLSYELIRR